jgi:selenoprotein W-related protein
MVEILKQYEMKIEEISLIPSNAGKFEVTVNGILAYSKLATGRHIETGEAAKCVGENL